MPNFRRGQIITCAKGRFDRAVKTRGRWVFNDACGGIEFNRRAFAFDNGFLYNIGLDGPFNPQRGFPFWDKAGDDGRGVFDISLVNPHHIVACNAAISGKIFFISARIAGEEIIFGQRDSFVEGAIEIAVKIDFDFCFKPLEIFFRNAVFFEAGKRGFNRGQKRVKVSACIGRRDEIKLAGNL